MSASPRKPQELGLQPGKHQTAGVSYQCKRGIHSNCYKVTCTCECHTDEKKCARLLDTNFDSVAFSQSN